MYLAETQEGRAFTPALSVMRRSSPTETEVLVVADGRMLSERDL